LIRCKATRWTWLRSLSKVWSGNNECKNLITKSTWRFHLLQAWKIRTDILLWLCIYVDNLVHLKVWQNCTFYLTFYLLWLIWRRQFEIAFRMFDLNGDGDVDAEEFEQVQVSDICDDQRNLLASAMLWSWDSVWKTLWQTSPSRKESILNCIYWWNGSP